MKFPKRKKTVSKIKNQNRLKKNKDGKTRFLKTGNRD